MCEKLLHIHILIKLFDDETLQLTIPIATNAGSYYYRKAYLLSCVKKEKITKKILNSSSIIPIITALASAT